MEMEMQTWVSARAGGTSDPKIACEPLNNEDKPSKTMEHGECHPDSPPESFWLSKDAEHDWFDRNAFMERRESTKGNTHSTNLNPGAHYSWKFKSKIAILALLKPQIPDFIDFKNRKSGTIRFFPKRSRSGGKSETGAMTEPASPNVSCIGRVRSNQGRRLRNRQTSEAKEKPVKTEKRKTGLFKSFLAHFSCACGKKSALKSNQPLPVNPLVRKGEPRRAQDSPLSELVPPGLGDLKRFVSGRRSASLVGEGAERV